MTFTLGEYQDIFLEEADEQLQELNQNLLELEKDRSNLDIINNIFRAAHSLKSSAAFVGLNDLSDLAHKMENLLQGIRDRTLDVSDEIIEIIFKCFDEISSVIETVASGEKPTQDLNWLIQDIQAISDKSSAASGGKERRGKTAAVEHGVPKTVLEPQDRKRIRDALDAGQSCTEVILFIDESAQMKWIKAQLILSNIARIGTIVKTIPSADMLSDDDMNNVFKIILLTDNTVDDIRKACDVDQVYRIDVRTIGMTKKEDKLVLTFGEPEVFIVEERRTAAPPELPQELPAAEEAAEPKEEAIEAVFESEEDDEEEEKVEVDKFISHRGTDRTEQDKKKLAALKSVKVSIDKLDLLLNNVGELVIANSGFYKLYDEMRKINIDKTVINEFKNRMEQMSRIAKDLQTGIMKTRMVQIGQVFSRFNRLVRDLSKEFGKRVELVVRGEETELDKKVIDSIGEPLMHLIRNAIDHGIEPPPDRKRLGKSDIAKVTLNAYQGGNQIIVEVSDDGRGLNTEMIKRKALERGYITTDMMSSMDTADLYNIIFTPGFSTADKITDISGRGVGMNVVKETVSELNGSVNIETEAGMGTRFVLSFPLTLAIIPAIMTKVSKEMYAVPLSDVIETIKISQNDITTIEGHEVINLRGEILSLLRLTNFVGIQSDHDIYKKIPVVVVGFGNRKIGLIVDYLEGKQEIVIKSLEQNYRTVEGLAGASILGDGSICLILDVSSMINKVIMDQDKLTRFDRAKIAEVGESKYEKVDEAGAKPKETKVPDKKEDLLKVGDAIDLEARSGRTESAGTAVKEKPLQARTEVRPAAKADAPATPRVQAEPAPAVSATKAAVSEARRSDVEIKKQVREALDDFRSELRDTVKSTIYSGGPSDHMISSLEIKKEDLSEFQVVANIGATNAAESLSKILDKRIDLSIPDVTVQPVEQIPKYLGAIESVYMGVMMPVVGDIRGTLLLILNEDIGFELVDTLFGTKTREMRDLTEDGESALKEITNIVGSSVINVIAEKANTVIKPGLPTIVHDYMQSIIDSILVMHNMVNDYAVVMDTTFYFEGDQIIGHLLYLPEAESLKIIIDKLRVNAGAD
ncbi:MAG: chemotaxis protein CheW [Spirochaetes bacterium]|nr:chemotaxis protein CheW [Spirochaetota bacterium]